MPDEVGHIVYEDVCNAKHGEVLRAMGRIEGKLDALGESLDGNGKPGIKTRLCIVEDSVSKLARTCTMVQEEKRKTAELWGNRAWEVAMRAAPWFLSMLLGGIMAAGYMKHGVL